MALDLSVGTRRYLGLDIGSRYIKLAEVSMAGDRPQVTRLSLVELPLPEDLGEEGTGNRRRLVVEGLRRLFHESGVYGREAVTHVSGFFVLSRSFTFPMMSAQEVKRYLTKEAESFLPGRAKLEDVVMDFQIVEEEERGGREMAQVLIAVARKEAIEEHISLLREAGLQPGMIDGSSLALFNVFTLRPSLLAVTPTAIIDAGAERSSMLIVGEGVVRFATELLMGGDLLSKALADSLRIPLTEAEQFKWRLTASGFEEGGKIDFGGTTYEVDSLRRILEPTVERMVIEIGRVLTYYERSDPKRKPVERVVLVGGSARCLGLVRTLQERLQLEVVLGDPLHDITLKVPRPTHPGMGDVSHLFSLAVGLCLKKVFPYVNSIDLSPPNVQKEVAVWRERQRLQSFAAVSASILLGALLLVLPSYFLYQYGISASGERFREMRRRVDEALSLKAENGGLQSKLAVFESLAQDREEWSVALREIARVTPEKVWLVNFESEDKLEAKEEETERIAATQRVVRRTVKLDMQGLSLSEDLVREFLHRLEDSSLFSDVQLIFMEQAKEGKEPAGLSGPLVQFDIEVQIRS